MTQSGEMTHRSVAGYRFITRIAMGSTGTVWRAVSRDGKKTVAIKLLNPKLLNDNSARSAFQREFQVCKDLKHSGLLNYMDAALLGKVPYLMMDFFPSETLKVHLTGHTGAPIFAKAGEIISKIGGALAYLHSNNIIHRDVKPENILVSADGDARLIDFSIALSGFSRWLQLSRKASGTPSYMSPEAIRKDKVTFAADIYSFGATIYEHLTGRPPFIADNLDSVMKMHLGTAPKPMSHYNREISPDLDKLVAQMLAKEPKDRLPDMNTFLSRFSRAKIFLE